MRENKLMVDIRKKFKELSKKIREQSGYINPYAQPFILTDGQFKNIVTNFTEENKNSDFYDMLRNYKNLCIVSEEGQQVISNPLYKGEN